VGPVWRGGNSREDEYLSMCYENSFKLVEKYDIKTIAFLAISTGAYRFPLERATRIAISQTKKFLERNTSWRESFLSALEGKHIIVIGRF